MTSRPTLPAILEADATGETAAIFADLRATLNIPFVNLIWRHLATIPGMLPCTWSIVKPLHHSAALEQASADLLRSVAVPDAITLPPCALDAVGVDADARGSIARIVANYNRGNAFNLLTLLVVRWLLEDKPGGAGSVSSGFPRVTATVPPAAMAALPSFASLTPTLKSLVLALDEFGRTAHSDAIASLYVHLSHWPGFLGLLYAVLLQSHHSGALRAEHLKTLTHAQALVQLHLLPAVIARPLPASLDRSLGLAGVDQFTTQMIGRMVMMGRVILAVLPHDETQASPTYTVSPRT